MNELFLNQAELLAALDAVSARALVSIRRAKLFPADMDERRAVLERGTESLKQRGMLHTDTDGRPVLDVQLAPIISTMAFPGIAIAVLTNDQQAGLRLLWFYQAEGHIIEHGMTRQKLHHITELPDVSALIARIQAFLAVKLASDAVTKAEPETSLEMQQEVFFTVKRLAEQHELERAKELLHSSGFAAGDTDALLKVLEQPLAAGNIALLRCAPESETIVDGRNLALLQDGRAAWSARQKVPGEPVLVVETTAATAIKEQLRAYLEELAQV
ncbi:MAG TPA: hypothetical protein VKV20_00460 [Ktedonobacteraceae bacterium]|jgi:hypothetical protein|nr:hypothetical protein [Ktedonobacteraceae bacterium]